MVATYGGDFYAGRPVVTVNRFGAGQAWYIAARGEEVFLEDFYARLAKQLGLHRVLEGELPEGVSAHLRTDGRREFVFLLNFVAAERTVALGRGRYRDVLTGAPVKGPLTLGGYGSVVLERLA
jgi:beta-galactosidase